MQNAELAQEIARFRTVILNREWLELHCNQLWAISAPSDSNKTFGWTQSLVKLVSNHLSDGVST